jgi:hypothetical protein
MTKNINSEVWRLIDNNAAIKRTLLEGLINTSSLARKLAEENNWQDNIDAVISAIRRYKGSSENKSSMTKIFKMLKTAKISTKTKLAAVLLKKNSEVRRKLSKLYLETDFEAGETFRIFEVTKYIELIVEEKMLKQVKDVMKKDEIEETLSGLGEISIDYGMNITKIPGVFATLSNELAMNNISIVDSMICHREHVIIVNERDIEKTFTTIFKITH